MTAPHHLRGYYAVGVLAVVPSCWCGRAIEHRGLHRRHMLREIDAVGRLAKMLDWWTR